MERSANTRASPMMTKGRTSQFIRISQADSRIRTRCGRDAACRGLDTTMVPTTFRLLVCNYLQCTVDQKASDRCVLRLQRIDDVILSFRLLSFIMSHVGFGHVVDQTRFPIPNHRANFIGNYRCCISLARVPNVSVTGFEPAQPKHRVYSAIQLSRVGGHPLKKPLTNPHRAMPLLTKNHA